MRTKNKSPTNILASENQTWPASIISWTILLAKDIFLLFLIFSTAQARKEAEEKLAVALANLIETAEEKGSCQAEAKFYHQELQRLTQANQQLRQELVEKTTNHEK